MFTEAKLFHKAGEGSGGGGGGDQHNLGWYATESALTTAHATASDGDWAIVGATDTVWVWDSDTTAWKDTDTKGQVTSVNGQTGDVVITGNDVLPDQTGNAGKFLTTDGTDASWSDTVPAINLSQTLSVSADTKLVVFKNGSTEVGNISATRNGPKIVSGNPNNWGVRIAGNLVPEGNYNLGWSAFGVVHKWNKIYVDKISSGDNNISVPNITGTMAVIRVNTTATLTSAGWSGGSQTVTVSGVTATGIVFVSPDPTDQSAYTSAGIVCTAQAANSLTFTATSTPASDLTVNVVML